MNSAKTITKLITIMIISICSACSIVNTVIKPSTTLNIKTAGDLNPDYEDRPSPIIIKVFELSSRTAFDTLDFFNLYQNAEKNLGPDLISQQELELQPNSKKDLNLNLSSNSKFVGIIGAYQNLDNASWRGVAEVDPKGYASIQINIEKLAIYIKD